MTGASVSVVIVSQDRPETLYLCLLSLLGQRGIVFEVVLVGDPTCAEVLDRLDLTQRVKFVPFEGQNISASRNLGISAASGDIIAFIDDDAVAPADWLATLVAGFGDAAADAVGGHVLGPDGVQYQWQSRQVHADGSCSDWDEESPAVVKTEGTNMAVRRKALEAINGFDERFTFYLDETDVNMRMHQKGMKTALVPQALVLHGYAASARRRADKVPLDLSQIGSSKAVFMQKHLPKDQHAVAWNKFRENQKKRLLRWMVSGHLEPRDIGNLLKTLKEGFVAGQNLPVRASILISPKSTPFLAFLDQSQFPDRIDISGWRGQIGKLRKQASQAVLQRKETHVHVKGLTYRKQKRQFQCDGAWWHFIPMF